MIPSPAFQERIFILNRCALETLQVLDARHRGKQVMG